MRFADYLASTGVSQEKAGEELGITQGRVSQLVRGEIPGPKLMERVREWSGNKVLPNDWFPAASAPASAAAGVAQ